ncbi:hypothetical protein [Intestinibacter bartlettii]|uniref:hypothetical protein n=1 Tax=Intestinibacter bartlettii TaxID=261299 RepID=UPI003218E1CA
MKDIVSNFREQYDYIFIDSPPILRMNDACIITQYVYGTIIVNAVGEVDSRISKITLEKLNKVGANIVGIILNKFKPENNNYYSYYGYYDEEKKGLKRLFHFKKYKKHNKHKK